MVTLDAILASLARIEQEQSAVHETIINRHVGSTEQLKRLEAGQMNILAAQDKLWQSLGAVERKLGDQQKLLDLLSEHQVHIETKVDGLGAGVALAIAELRKDLGKPREVEPLRLSNDMHTLFMDLLDELRVTRFALSTRSASPLGGKARSGTKRKRTARRTRK